LSAFRVLLCVSENTYFTPGLAKRKLIGSLDS
jgi:hypothetical protein